MRTALLLSTVFVGILAVTYGFECYSCIYDEVTNYGDRKCLDDPENAGKQTCNPVLYPYPHCGKIYSKVNGKKSVWRMCDSALTNIKIDECQEGKDSNGNKGSLCVCPTDKCNGATAKTIGLVTVLPLLVSAVYSLF